MRSLRDVPVGRTTTTACTPCSSSRCPLHSLPHSTWQPSPSLVLSSLFPQFWIVGKETCCSFFFLLKKCKVSNVRISENKLLHSLPHSSLASQPHSPATQQQPTGPLTAALVLRRCTLYGAVAVPSDSRRCSKYGNMWWCAALPIIVTPRFQLSSPHFRPFPPSSPGDHTQCDSNSPDL
jgi:hypothetical protein